MIVHTWNDYEAARAAARQEYWDWRQRNAFECECLDKALDAFKATLQNLEHAKEKNDEEESRRKR